jgi:hypothetical protein
VIPGHVPGTIRDANFKNGFCQIDSVGGLDCELRIRADAPTALPCQTYAFFPQHSPDCLYRCFQMLRQSRSVPDGLSLRRRFFQRGQHLLAKLLRNRGGLPDRARSCSPAIPSASNRRRQSITVFGRTFKLSATVLTGFPSRHPNTIRARSTNRASIVRLCDQSSKIWRSSCEHSGTGCFGQRHLLCPTTLSNITHLCK